MLRRHHTFHLSWQSGWYLPHVSEIKRRDVSRRRACRPLMPSSAPAPGPSYGRHVLASSYRTRLKSPGQRLLLHQRRFVDSQEGSLQFAVCSLHSTQLIKTFRAFYVNRQLLTNLIICTFGYTQTHTHTLSLSLSLLDILICIVFAATNKGVDSAGILRRTCWGSMLSLTSFNSQQAIWISSKTARLFQQSDRPEFIRRDD